MTGLVTYWLEELREAEEAVVTLLPMEFRPLSKATRLAIRRARISLWGDINRYAVHLRDCGGLLFLRWPE